MGRPRTGELEILWGEGTRVWSVWSGRAVLDGIGGIVRVKCKKSVDGWMERSNGGSILY